jgi:hypothetical protein
MAVPVLWLFGLLVAYAAAAGTVARRRFAVPAVLLPGLAVVLYLPELGVGGYRTLTRPTLLWVVLMAVVLIAVGLLPRPVSWWVGYAGALAAAWVAVTWAVWLFNLPGFADAGGIYRLDTGYAWRWFPASLMDVYAGPGPRSASEGSELSSAFVVSDFAEIYPSVLLVLGVFSVAYVIGVCEHRDFPEPEADRYEVSGGSSDRVVGVIHGRLGSTS